MNVSLPKVAVSLLVTLLGFRVSAQQQSSPTNSPDDKGEVATIAGTVVRSGTDEPLRKARVTLSGKDNKAPRVRVAVTGADGKFALEGIPPGAYDLDADHDGYVAKSYGEDNAGEGAAVLSLGAGQKMSDLIFRLEKCGVIAGRVVDEDGEPVRNVSVEAVRRATYRGKVAAVSVKQFETNDLGEYRLFDLPPGRYYIRATPNFGNMLEATAVGWASGAPEKKPENSYVATYYPGVSDFSRASLVELRTGDEIPSMDMSLIKNRTYKIRGQVVDVTESNAGQEYSVTIMPEDGSGSFQLQGLVDPKDGSFELGGLSPGGYLLMAVGFGGTQQPVKGFVRVDITFADVDSVKVVIKHGVEMRGQVVMESKPVLPKRLVISLEAKEPNLAMSGRHARVKADGSFEMHDVLEGVYRVEVSSECEECYLKAARMNGVDVLDRGLQVVGALPQTLELVYSANGGTLDGMVTKDDDLPAAGARVSLVPDTPSRDRSVRYRSGATDQYGRFTIQGVTPGRYKAFAFRKSEDDDESEDPDFMRPFESKGESVSVDEGGKKTLHLKVIAVDAETPPK